MLTRFILNVQNDYDYLNHTKTFNQPEIMDMVNRWRGICDSYPEKRSVLITLP